MTGHGKTVFLIVLLVLTLTACTGPFQPADATPPGAGEDVKQPGEQGGGKDPGDRDEGRDQGGKDQSKGDIDYKAVKPNEAGKDYDTDVPCNRGHRRGMVTKMG